MVIVERGKNGDKKNNAGSTIDVEMDIW